MPEILAEKIRELDLFDLIKLLRQIQMSDQDAFDLIKEKLEDL